MKLYGHPDSGHVFKVRFCLRSAELAHDYEVVDIWADRGSRSAQFRAASRHCEVPLLIDGDQSLIQSNAILLYIARTYAVFGGQSEQTMQRSLEWLMWEANKIGMCLPQLRADKKFAGSQLSEGAREWLLARFEHDVSVLENELADGRAFILGDELSVADFSLCGYLMYASEAQLQLPAGVDAWLARLRSSHGWADPYTLLG